MNFPKYPRKSHATGQARISIKGRCYYLGKFGSPESHEEYRRLMAEFAMGNFTPAPRSAGPQRISISKMVALWLSSTDTAPKELEQVKLAIVPLDRLFGGSMADEFDAKRLKTLRDAMISGSWMNAKERAVRKKMGKPCDWSRSNVNHQIARVKRLFQWAEIEGHIAKGVWQHLAALGPIPRRAAVRTTEKRKPVDFESQVKPCLPFLPPQVAAAVQVQYYAGMRPGEVLSMRRNEVDMVTLPGVWLYRPTEHKTDYRGDELIKVIGPLGQTVLAPWLMAAEPDGYVFPPLRNRYQRGRYDVHGYGVAIARACVRAGVVKWSAYCLRHAAARRAEEAGGLAGAAAHLGHRGLETTLVYTGRQNLAIAAELAKKIG